jgi:hypothetical protein
MPTERLSMRHIREVLRPPAPQRRHVATRRCPHPGLGPRHGQQVPEPNRRGGLTWPLPPELDDDVRLENRLYPPPSDQPSDERPQPDWALVHRELRARTSR